VHVPALDSDHARPGRFGVPDPARN
jgi:hypothetical protein